MKKDITVIILAAGLGTRMKSTKAKVLHEAGGDTLLNHVIRAALQLVAPESIVVVVGHQATEVRRSVRAPGIRFAVQPEQKGTGHAVLCARESIPGSEGVLLILNGDGPLVRASTLQAIVGLREERRVAGAIITTDLADPTGYGRIVRDSEGLVAAIVEQKSGSPEQLQIREVNPGVYCFDAELFWSYACEISPNNAAREYYLTDMVEILRQHGQRVAPLKIDDPTELLGINTRIELAIADRLLRTRKTDELMLAGVTIEYPESVTIDVEVEIGADTIVEANVQLRGRTRVGANCRIGTGSVLRDCQIAERAAILPYVIADASTIGAEASVGPFSRLRMNAEAKERTHIGNFVELKKTQLGAGSKASHLTYLGDAVIGSGVNVGAGTITCNYDGARKHQTTIGDNVFVGSNSTIVAPLTVEEGAYIAAGSVITKSVDKDSLAIGRAFQTDKPGWAKKRRESNKSKS